MENIRPIDTEADYDWALKEIARYFENESSIGTSGDERLRMLLRRVGDYEHKHWPI